MTATQADARDAGNPAGGVRRRADAALGRMPWPALALWCSVWACSRRQVVGDWQFFQRAAHLLSGPHPLSLYDRAPELQIGPLALLAGWPLQAWPTWAVHLLLAAIGLAALFATSVAAPTCDQRTLLIAGLAVVPAWSFVVWSGHLDDALVVLLTSASAVAVRRDRSLLAGALLGAAVAAKPWAAATVPLLLGLRSGRPRALGLAALAGVGPYLLFIAADPGTLHALSSFRIPVAATSGLRLLGISAGPFPAWVRPAQLLVGAGLGLLAVRRGRWYAVPLVAVAVRVALDPGAVGYYASALAVTAALVDLWSPRVVPLASLVVAVGVFYPAFLGLQAARRGEVFPTGPSGSLVVAAVRVAACAAVIAIALLNAEQGSQVARGASR